MTAFWLPTRLPDRSCRGSILTTSSRMSGLKDDPSLVLVAQLTDVKLEDVEIDMELTMVPKIIKTLMNGEKVVSYCFRPKDPAKVTPGEGGQTE